MQSVDAPLAKDGHGAREAPASPLHAESTRNLDKIFMLVATAARMGVGLLTFVVLARYLGPLSFGVIATAMAYSSFAGILSDYGFTTSALRLASADPEQSGTVLGEVISTKLILSLLVTIVCVGVAIALLPVAVLPVYALVHLGMTSYSFGEFLLIAARARRRFDVEVRLVLTGSVMMLVIVGGVAALTGDLFAAACAIAATRLLYLLLVGVAMRGWVDFAAVLRWRPDRILAQLRASRGFAADSILTMLSGQIDVLMYGALLTAHDVGVYQAGARLVQVIMPFAVVLSAVYMPALSAAALKGNEAAFRHNARRLNLEFAALAIVCGIGFALAGPILTTAIYGLRYAPLAPLWSGFSVYVLLRLASAAFGIQLAALGNVKARIATQLACILVFAALALIVMPRVGFSASAWILAASSVPMLLIYSSVLAIKARRGYGSSPLWITAALLAVVVALATLT